MNRPLASVALLLIPNAHAADWGNPSRAEAPRILLPLHLESVPPAHILLDELDYYLSNDAEGNYQKSKLAIEHHLKLLYQHYLTEACMQINQMPLWSHSEHFLERMPRFFLDCLVKMRWPVHTTALQVALRKLESLLPTDPLDMIDCAAGKPIGQILRLYAYQKPAGARDFLLNYAQSHDPDVAYAAYCSLLALHDIPEPTLRDLVQDYWHINKEKDLLELPLEMRKIALLIAVEEGMQSGHFLDWLEASSLEVVSNYLSTHQYQEHAEILSQVLADPHKKTNQELIEQKVFPQLRMQYILMQEPSVRQLIAKELYQLYAAQD